MSTAPGAVRRRALFPGLAATATANAASEPVPAGTPLRGDAGLARIAADLRAAEVLSAAAVSRHAAVERSGDIAAMASAREEIEAAAERVDRMIDCLAAVPAEGLLGIAIKASRLCDSLIRNRGDLLVAEGALVASLLADCRRIAQDVDDRPSRQPP